jgi:class 3 adenylate cyclase/tetratricopeptide (TPR) repeat protein
MRCPACSFENPEGMKFCGNCGGRMPERAIGAAPERRIVTALFADVKGSTTFAERLDPEEWHEIVDGAFRALRPPIDRFGGTIVRELGDGILAFFGAPVSHEDDPERAVRAGIELLHATAGYRAQLVRERGDEFSGFDIRIGINTGVAVIGFVGDRGVEYTGQGDAVNVAARLQSVAAPGTLVVSEHTLKLVPPVFEWEPLGELDLKGREGKMSAFAVRGLSATASRVRPRDLLTPLVGRARELAALREGIAEVRRGSGWIVSLVADAGLGKTRLIDEVRKEWEAEPVAGQRWTEARGQSYEVDRSYGLVRQHLLGLAGVTDADPPETIREGVIGLLPPERRTDEKALRTLEVFLDVAPAGDAPGAPEGQQLREEVHGLMRDIARSVAERQAVIVFDDLQWSDAASADLLTEIFGLVDETPVLFILAFRPDRQAPSWRIKQKLETDLPHRYSEITLPPLTSAEGRELLDQILPGDDLPGSLRVRVIDKAEGNPFFLEEIVRSLIDDGAVTRGTDGRWQAARGDADIRLPESLQSVLAARIDRLQQGQRETLQAAAVIGRTFFYRILVAIREASDKLDQQLRDLQRLQIVREEAREPEREYAFRHALTQEAAYGSILQRKRRDLHARVAEALEALFPERVEEEEFAALVARHYAEAQDPRALRYLKMAGDRAQRLFDLEAADTHYRRALTLVRRDRDDPALLGDLFVHYGRVFELRGDYARAMELYRDLEKLGNERADAAIIGTALSAQLVLFTNPTPFLDAVKAAEILDRQIVLARERGDRTLLAKLLWNKAQAAFWRGDAEASVNAALESEAIARETGDKEQLGFTLNQLGQAYVHGGRVRAGEGPLREAVALFHEVGNKPMEADSWSTLSFLHFYSGELDEAEKSGGRAFEIADSVNNDWGRAYGLFTPSFVHNERGDWDRAIDAYEDAIRFAERGGFQAGRTAAGSDLGLLYATIGAHDRAKTVHEMAIVNARDNFPIWKDWPVAQAARAALLRGDLDAARGYLGDLAEVPPVVGDVYMGTVTALARSEYALATGDTSAAIEAARAGRRYADTRNLVPFQDDFDLAEGEASFRAGDLTGAIASLTRAVASSHRRRTRRLLWRCLGLLAAIYETQGRGDEARAAREEAAAVVDHIAASLRERGLDGTFRAQPAVAEALGRVPTS